MDMQHAIMIKQAENNADMQAIFQNAQKEGLQTVPFTREMLDSSDDKLVVQRIEEKAFSDVEYL